MISEKMFKDAIFGLSSDRDLALGSSPEHADVLDKWLSGIMEKRIRELQEMDTETKKRLYVQHKIEYDREGNFFPGARGGQKELSEILINDINVLADLYVFEAEFGDSSIEEINTLLRCEKQIDENVTAIFGGPESILEMYNQIKENSKNTEPS